MAVTLNASTSTGYIQTADTSGILTLQNNGTDAVTVTSGNVGIGTSSPAVKLDVAGNIQTSNNYMASAASYVYSYAGGTTAQVRSGIYMDGTNQILALFSANTERARITSGGEVYIAGTTDQGAYNLQCNGTGVWGAGAYVNGSDERIKEDIAPLTSGLDVVTKLNPVTYRYKEDWSKDQSIQPGFIAQEMLVAMEGQDYVDGVVSQGGAAGYYSVAYQNIIPLLTKAIQEQQQMIETLQAKVAALEGGA